ncbi:DUF3012 domain-containing protein [Litoribacillus peritrichatus]|uniref:DUF3012 domain-containing protein n=1 Tax=Litoribacillus peritrichatus TaxID=718191 RepID=A0ABP7N7L0_9GAMM
MKKILLISIFSLQLLGCSAEIGSEAWCADLDEKPKGDWTMNEMKDYTKHCIFN